MNKKTTDLVSKVYSNIDLDTLDELEGMAHKESGYWESCKVFWDQVHDLPYSRLSLGQKNWLDRIELACKNHKESR